MTPRADVIAGVAHVAMGPKSNSPAAVHPPLWNRSGAMAPACAAGRIVEHVGRAVEQSGGVSHATNAENSSRAGRVGDRLRRHRAATDHLSGQRPEPAAAEQRSRRRARGGPSRAPASIRSRSRSSPSQPAPAQQQGGRVRGAAGGAAGGAVIGAVAGDAGKGAAVGAVTGTVVGGSRQRRANRASGEQQQASQQQSSQAMVTFNRAVGACMTGRGYTVQ